MAVERRTNGIWIASLFWLVCLLAALVGATLRNYDIASLLPLAGLAAIPAATSLILSPVIRREWAQIIVIFLWLALAVVACLVFGFMPMALLFLCAPAMAALFEREKVVEAMILAGLTAAGLFYFAQRGEFGDINLADGNQINWGVKTGIASTIALLIGALYAVSSSRASAAETPLSRDLLDAVPGGLLRVGKNNRVKMITEVAAAQLKLGDETKGLSVKDIFDDPEKRDELMFVIDKARENNRKVSRKFRLLENGDYISAEITAGPLKGGDVLLHIYDSTQHENRVNSLHQAYSAAQKDADSRSLFFAGVSHELRTPLNAIIGFSDMMRSRLFGPLPSKYAEYADLIHDSGQHMLDLIGDVLDISKVEAGKYDLIYQSFDAADVIRSSAKMLRPAADSAEIRMDVEVHDKSGELLVDADRKAMRQIILNLVSNAIKFTPKGGRVLIRGDFDGNYLRLGVVDNGAGMSAEDLETVGQPYVQSDSGVASETRGTGLGLSLVKSLAALHGGRLELSSQKGIGTTAEVLIPRRRSNPDNSPV